MKFVDASVLAPAQDGLVKMEDRKRPASYDSADSAPPLKRQATSINGKSKAHPDTDMPWKDDVQSFQKEAIYRQMQEYKREKNLLEGRLNELKKKSSYHDDHLRVIDAWFKQLVDEVCTLINPSTDPRSASDHASFPSALLFTDNDTFQQHLQQRSKDIKSAITTLYAGAPEPSPDVSKLQVRLNELLADEKGRIVSLERVIAERDSLETQLENATMRYMQAEKRLDRVKSASVAKMERGTFMGSQKDAGAATADSIKPENKDDMVMTNGNSDEFGDHSDLKEEHGKLLAISEKQKEQIAAMAVENEKLTEQMSALSVKNTRVTEEDFAGSDLFKMMKTQYEDIIKKINHLEATNIQLREEAQKLQAERTEYRIRLEAESQSAISEKEIQLTKAENDLVRIRNARDELSSDLSRKKALEEQDRLASAKLRDLNAAHEERVKALESEIERLRLQLGQIEPPTSDVTSLSIEELRSRYATLDQASSMLNSEVASMTVALKKTSGLASLKVAEISGYEDKITRLAAEKSRAIEKYFAAMKLKEAREAEMRTLKLQNAKASDVVSQLKEAETEARNLALNYEKQISELKDALVSTSAQCRASQQQTSESNMTIDSYKGQISKLERLVTEKDASVSSVCSKLRTMETETEALKLDLRHTQQTLETAKSRISSGGNDELEDYRRIVFCNVCKSNIKDTCLMTCKHVFCRNCVQERIDSRSRKCPNCGKSFGASDAQRITI